MHADCFMKCDQTFEPHDVVKVGAVVGLQQELRRRQAEPEPAVHPEEGRQEGLLQRGPARRRPLQGDGRGVQPQAVPK